MSIVSWRAMNEYTEPKYTSYRTRLDDALFGSAPAEEVIRITEFAGAELEKCILQGNCHEDDIAELLFMLRYGDEKKWQPIMEHYLNGDDPTAAHVALVTLCRFHGLTDQYVGKLIEFIRGVPWDPFYELQFWAWCIVADYLKEHTAPELLQELIRIIEDEGQTMEQRDNAYASLLNAMGVERDKTHTVSYSKSDPSILEAAKERLRREQG